ncbi:MAG: glycosyltransferase [Xanthobacteraceae bacterium]
MSADPKVSVIMPVRDGARWVREAVESMLCQTLDALELIIIDDGSSDETPAILQALGRRDGRIRIVQQQAEGLVAALNRGLTLAQAPLLARLDADDFAAPDRLARQVSCFDSDKSLVLLGSWATKIDNGGRAVGLLRPETDAQRLPAILMRRNPFIHSSTMLRTSLLRDLGGYRSAFLGAEDYDLWLRLSECGTIANLPHALIRYRVHAASTSSSMSLRQSFSARLARAAAAGRRLNGVDPADELRGPPDWWSSEATAGFSAEASHICRFLDCASRPVIEARQAGDVRPLSADEVFGLSHAEKRVACRSMLNFMTTRKGVKLIPPSRTAAMAAALLLGRALFRA